MANDMHPASPVNYRRINRLRPDVALLAVMEAGQGLIAEIEEARTALAADGISFELLMPNRNAPRDDPYLYFKED